MKRSVYFSISKVALCGLGLAPLLFCPAARAQCSTTVPCDPGPRPIGNQFALFAGPVSGGVALLPTPVHDTRQPPDANGNEGAGHVLNNAGAFGPFWGRAGAIFGQQATVTGIIDPATGNPTLLGLGPAFNGTSCFMCHSQPAIGGTSPSLNPQLGAAHAFGASNPENLSAFITSTGPIREARFITDPADTSRNTLDGGVHELFTIQGRSDAPTGCVLAQPDFITQISNNNVIFRIPTPTFGLGLVENVADVDLAANLQASSASATAAAAASAAATPQSAAPAVVQPGILNRNGNDGTVTRFGWKAQNKSLLLFAGEAANVEMGVTNELFNNEKVPGSGCASNGLPEDFTHVVFPHGDTDPDVDAFVSSAIENFATFMRINGAPAQCDFASGVDPTGAAVCNPLSASALAGRNVFSRIGCAACHTLILTTAPSSVPGLSNRTFFPFSDFALHHMGSNLADGVTQGLAGPDMFRTAPLWGLGQRLFFMHDGRANNLIDAILAHDSDNRCFNTNNVSNFVVTFPGSGEVNFNSSVQTHSCGSEAHGSVTNFKNATPGDRQNLLNFLRSL